jgi:OHCU decarboxylase
VDAPLVSVTPQLPPIETLNGLPRDAFAAALRLLFEAAAPLANALFESRPFPSYAALLDHAVSIVGQLSRAERIEVVNAHPRIGAPAAAVREASTLSFREQGYDRESDLDPADLSRTYARLEELNQQYEARFGFRFVVFVNGRPKSEIVEVLQQRLDGTPDAELQTAVSEMFSIARDRLVKVRSYDARMHDPAHQAILDELHAAALATYGEERAAERVVQSALEAAATATWRVLLERLDSTASP